MEAAEAWNSRSSSATGEEIEPCPFCGGGPDAYEWTNKQGEERFVIECHGCNCRPMLIAETRDYVVDAWSTRAGDAS